MTGRVTLWMGRRRPRKMGKMDKTEKQYAIKKKKKERKK